MSKATAEQHAELDAEYQALLIEDDQPLAFYVNQDVFRMWFAEKEYLDRYGQRYPQIVNIQVPRYDG